MISKIIYKDLKMGIKSKNVSLLLIRLKLFQTIGEYSQISLFFSCKLNFNFELKVSTDCMILGSLPTSKLCSPRFHSTRSPASRHSGTDSRNRDQSIPPPRPPRPLLQRIRSRQLWEEALVRVKDLQETCFYFFILVFHETLMY